MNNDDLAAVKLLTAQELKQRLELIWQGKLINTMHINKFNNSEIGWRINGIYISRGAKVNNKRKPKRNG